MSDYDPSFRSLAPNVRSRIDNAFYSALPKIRVSDRGSTYDAPGGFFLDDDHSMAGGFLPPSPPAVVQQGGHESGESEEPSHIPLSRIPYALQLLDLPPDDEDVLAVFRNAATGWGDDHHSSRRTRRHDAMVTGEEDEVVEEHVSLKDWRAVCAALMDDGGYIEGAKEGDAIDEEEESADADATGQDLSSGLEESSGESSDEYRSEARSQKRPRKSSARPGVTQKTRPRKTRSAAARRRSPLSPSISAEITLRQRRECLQAFLLFFPAVPEEVAKHRRLGVRELSAAATALNEKIKAEEIIEMLEAFSTSPDKTMSLSDFEKMMIAARLA